MARGGGFLARIGRAIRNVVAPRPSPPREPPREPPGPPPPEEPSARDYKEIWRNEGGKGSYKKNLKVFHNVVDPVEKDPEARLELWESYVHNIVAGRGRFRRQSTSNMF